MLQFDMLLYPLVALLFSLAATRLLITFLPRLGCVAHPREGHIHKQPVPTGGGIGLLLVVTVVGGILLVTHAQQISSSTLERLPAMIIPFLVITLIGFADDRIDLHYKTKFLMQVSAGVVTWLLGLRLETVAGLHLPLPISCFLTTFWIFLFMNAYNLIDGIDGLASEMSIIASIFTAVLFFWIGLPVEATLALLLAAAVLGFYRYNRHPARIFLGDTGSTGIGYLLGALGLLYHNEVNSLTSAIAPILISAIPWFDGFLALWRRLACKILMRQRGEEVTQKMLGRDMNHLHHRYLARLSDQTAVGWLFSSRAVVICAVVVAIEVSSAWIKLGWLVVMGAIILFAVIRVADLEVASTRRILANWFTKNAR